MQIAQMLRYPKMVFLSTNIQMREYSFKNTIYLFF